jgi:hypothetical protein
MRLNNHAARFVGLRLVLEEFQQLAGADAMYVPTFVNYEASVVSEELLSERLFGQAASGLLCGRISGRYLEGLQQLRWDHRMGDRGIQLTQILSSDDFKSFMRLCIEIEYGLINHPWSPYQPNEQALRSLWSILCWVLNQLLAEYTFTYVHQ